jgi:hypothetical protein
LRKPFGRSGASPHHRINVANQKRPSIVADLPLSQVKAAVLR